MKAEDAKRTVAQNTANVQLNALSMAGQYVLDVYRTPEVQSYIQQMALASLPEILRGIGINMPYGTIIEGETLPLHTPAPIAPAQPAAESSPPAERRSLFNWFRRPAAAEQPAAAGHEDAVAATIAAMVARGELIVPVSNPTHDAARQEQPAAAPPPQGRGDNGTPAKPIVPPGGSAGNF
jgi:hypothetical protein